MRHISVAAESWPIAGTFTISRGSKTSAEVVVVEIAEDGAVGRGECVPYPRYGETVPGAIAQIESIRTRLERGLERDALQTELPAGTARNAIDCALWDLAAKRTGRPAWQLAGLPPPRPLVTAYTLSLGTPEAMGEAARTHSHRPLLKLKLAGSDDLPRVQAVHANAPNARLIVDANEGWTPDLVVQLPPLLALLGVELIEQPLPAGKDEALARAQGPIPFCADESCHDRAGLAALAGKYKAINIKLEKTGGLSEALKLAAAAEAQSLALMVSCIVGTSLAMAPALLVAQRARWVDLDGPLLLARDRSPGLRYDGSRIEPAPPALWG